METFDLVQKFGGLLGCVNWCIIIMENFSPSGKLCKNGVEGCSQVFFDKFRAMYFLVL